MQTFEDVCHSALRFVFISHSLNLAFGQNCRLVTRFQLLVRQKVLSNNSVYRFEVLQDRCAWVLGKVRRLFLNRFQRVKGLSVTSRVEVFFRAEQIDFFSYGLVAVDTGRGYERAVSVAHVQGNVGRLLPTDLAVSTYLMS